MKTLLRWLGLVLTLIVARVLLALAILGGVVFLIGTGLQSAGLPIPTAAQIEQRMQPALHQLAPLLQRIHPVGPASEASPFQPPTPAQSQP
ncbi:MULTISPECIES: hypothetical protein [unclassified Thiomonas]|uniref:hypothetical protein n=1 Tax=unclassified Thiomonas TaxID=2625466 RepID=UPI0004DB9E58|nr:MULTISPECIES: hypothetical protein [unclassified Thiomonas]CDW96330.1 exported hypothetical protein [Thiomonas sp. CB2]VDY11207.1 protein of unknown function [Thiomonas sp. Sup16B3]